jgi:hypothetical protein
LGWRAVPGEGRTVNQTLLLVLAIVVIVALVAWGVLRTRPSSGRKAEDSPFGTSTEGMKICPKCGMGNLWTERRCSACGRPLAG